jgi:hypothetical protein
MFFFGILPLTHDDCQNRAIFPSPIVTSVDAAKKSLSLLLTGRLRPFHVLSLCFHWNHSHLSLRALAKRSRCRRAVYDLWVFYPLGTL